MLEMEKPLILWAVLANILLLTTCSVSSLSSESSSDTSSSVWTSSSSSATSSKSTSIVRVNIKQPRNNDCGINQRRVNCPSGVCVPKTCDDVGLPVACPDLLPNAPCPGGPGCICIENYVRNKQGVCIPMKQCPSCGGDKNAVSGCGLNCNRLCYNHNNLKRQFQCPDECLYNACDCKRGFVFDEIRRKCVKPGECSKLECKKPNQVYDPCPAPCPLRTCGIDDAALDCIPSLYPGHPDCAPPKCRCKDGFYKNDKGECVTQDECPTCPGINEIYDACPAPCPPQRCDVDPALILCLVPPQIGDPECEPGCRCIDGYVRNYTGNVCIRREDCPKCPQNEIFDICDAPCPPRRCDVDERLIRCTAPPKPGDPNCVEGCRCIDEYKRDSNGVCIPKEDCSICPGVNEIFDPCPAPCPPQRCDVDPAVILCAVPPQNGDPECEPGCRCIDGYVRNYTGNVCIKREDCPKCPQNEIYDICDAPCPPRRCDVDERLIRCAAPPKPGDPNCVEGCRCIDGYKRDSNGVCIPKEDCSICPGINEIFDPCPAPCPPQRCDVDPAVILCAVPPQNGDPECEPGCRCIDGYVRNYTGNVCIKREDCPKCPQNEIYDICDAPCPPRRCDVDERLIRCAAPPKPGDPNCVEGCRCVDGYKRDSNGVCIPKEDCPKCTNSHEVYDPCPPTCPPQTCDSINKTYYCPNQPVGKGGEIIQTCEGQCVCELGYYRNKIGDCISEENCLKCTGPHEYFSCGSACDNVCGLLDKQNQTNCPIINVKCNDKCYCEEGYARDENNICILIEDCNVPKCKKYERYDACPAYLCQPFNCSQIGFPVPCPSYADLTKCPGKPGCVCVDGYVRNDKTGRCIPKEQCPSCGGDKNATSGCGVNCNKRCRDVGKKPGACIEICYENACDCNDGYYLDENTDQCVKPEDCSTVCPINEIYSECVQAICSPKKCSELGFPVRCPRIDPKFCRKGCVCRDGKVRNSKGICVDRSECPSCGGDSNAQSGCGLHCNRRCSDIGQEPEVCVGLCYDNGCDCKEGFYFDEDLKKCVLPNDCPQPLCKKNEYFNNCSNSDCSPQTCNDIGFPIKCTDIEDPSQCTEDCLCKEGYVRNNDGICIPSRECPSCGGDPNAVSGCGGYCNQKCSNIGKEPEACILICYVNACDCREGYYYDEVRKLCVPPGDCSSPQCPDNEYYSNCINGDCSVQNCNDVGFPISCPRIDPKYCKGGCLCNEGYARNKKGVCVPINECPTCKGDPNQVSGCGVYCNQKCSDLDKEPGACILICYENSCDCREGYYLDEGTGRCVLPWDCPPQCPENEYYSSCTNGDCSVQNCTDLGLPIACPRINPKYCKKGCLCKEGYARNSDGICVSLKECRTCKGDPNRVSGCGVYCNQRCSDIGLEPGACIDVCYENECECKEGYYLDTKTDKCVLPEKCNSCKNDPNRVPGCGVYCNQRCADVGKEPGGCIAVCYDNACDCKKGYYLDENIDKCVKPKDCTPVCGDNEIFSECINGGCDPKNCSQLGKDVPCVKLDPKKCIKGCLCKKGYLRDKNGVCVPESECSSNLCPRPNEVYKSCSFNCPPQTCESLDRVYICPIREGDICKSQCVCKEGFYRNKIGECISEADCRKCMGPHEYFSCGGACDNVCATIKKQNQTNCPIVNVKCNDMCYCEKNYARARNNTCIPIDKCKESQCGVNERYEKCPEKLGGPFTCSQLGFPIKDNSKKKCEKPACVCVDGYVRDSNKVCISKADCPTCKGDPNRVSGCGVYCNQRCSDIGLEPGACIDVCYENECDCKKGYYLDTKTDKCVLPEKCNSCKNDPNRIPGCGVYCNQRCADVGKEPGACIAVCYDNACDCKKRYYLDENIDKCVKAKDCTPVCGDNEVFSECINGGCDPKNCSQLGKDVPCVKLDPKKCIKGCLCKKGYLRDKNGVCVPESECNSNLCLRPNEVYKSCSFNCPPQTCESLDRVYVCPIREGDICKAQCVCKEGFYRNKIGECISEADCRKCMGPHEYFSCGGACDNVCATIKKQNQTNCPIVNVKCNEMCYCEKNYARARNNTCIPIDKCKESQCGVNERYEKCPEKLGGPFTCSQLGFPIKDNSKKKCEKPACVCVDGYVRDSNKVCIPKADCPTCKGDPNRVSGCGVYCNKRCSDIGLEPGACIDVCYENECDCSDGYYLDTKTDKCVLPQNCTSCKNDPNRVPGCGVYCNQRCADVGKEPGGCIAVCYDNACDCKKGYYLDENIDKCVMASDCTPVCSNNEVFSECINGGCDPKNCSQLGKDVPCVKLDPKKCIKGCLCKKGYLRDENGVCVPESECNPNLCPRLNEVYKSCSFNCPPQTCESLDRVYVCPIREGDICKAQCVCKEGFYRNKIGECISEADCRKCMGPHEYFSCGGACDNVCATIKKQNQTNCPFVNVKCNEMCYCEKNYARARNNTCIPIDKCKESQCGVNEKYVKCPQKLRGPFTCSQLGFPVKDNSKKKCDKPACVCVDGYVRDSNKVCIPKTDCPSCGGDKNAISGCGNCIDLCEDLDDDEPKFCTQICNENACNCRDGYYYDKKLKKCVLPEQCTSICDDVNEYFENCVNPRCRAQTCDELGFPLNCFTNSSECKKGCYCKDDFVRNEDGKCIPVKNCPSCGGDVNAQSGCGVNCLKKCYDLANPKRPRPCLKICNLNGCDCKDGFYLDENTGQCVKADECTPICGKNEVYDPCTNGGCGFRKCSQIGGPQLCIDPIKCIKGCKCKQDYLRAKNGTCIPIEKCPEAKCPKKERFEKCPAALCQPQTCDDLGIELPCLPTDGGFCLGGPGCVCKDELVRNKKNECIPKRQCPSCGGDPNAWFGCGVNCGKHCDDVFNKTRPCPRICYPNSCDCKDGFFYNDITGKCVKSSECPPPCPENEQRDFCVNGYCGIRNCSEANGPILCVDPFECEIGCTCVEGYLRDDLTGVCVPECECPIPPEKCNPPKCVTCINCTEGPPVNETTAIANFELGNDLLNREFLYQLVKGRPGESFMFSAFSVLIALAQLSLYAVGTALDQLLRLLNLKSKDEIRTIFPILIKNYQTQESVIFELAIKYYGSIKHPFTRKFIEEAQGIFKSEGQSINFAKNVEAANIINDWVRNRTNNLINDLIDPSMLSEETRMVLVNALYFLGDWVYPFNPNETTPQKFYYGTSDNDVLSLPTMCQQKRFLYAESNYLDCQILQLPYKGQNFTFDIYLPRTRDGLRSMIEKIRNTDNIFARTRKLLKYETVKACIPKMDIATDISNLSELLKMANLTAPFDPNSAGFECIFEDESKVYISDAVQKTRLKVDETGTEAAAATAVVLTYRSLQPTSVYTFNADRPFLFIIRFLDSIVFIGVFYK